MYPLLLIVLVQICLSVSVNGSNCDSFQTTPPSTLSDLLKNNQIKRSIGDAPFYVLVGCLLKEQNYINENNALNLRDLLQTLRPDFLSKRSFFNQYNNVATICSNTKGGDPAETVRLVHQCIESEIEKMNQQIF